MSKLKFDAATPLYTSDAAAWPIDQLPKVLSKLYASDKPIVLFVHGRGKEPEKSIHGATFAKGQAVHKIELGYNVKVLMFNWDSAFHGINVTDREVPLSHTKAGGVALGKTLTALHQFQTANPNVKRPALLVHSMGSIVAQRAVEDGHWPQASGLFSAVIFSQPDADDVGHASWLDHLSQQERVFVTQNKDDHVLSHSTDARPPGAHALGLGTSQPLAHHATYVDLSNMGALNDEDDDHEVFGKGAMNGQLYVCQFFTEVLTGQPVTLDPAINAAHIEHGVIYRLRSLYKPEAPCMKVPHLPHQ